jgi:hypothetical protein
MEHEHYKHNAAASDSDINIRIPHPTKVVHKVLPFTSKDNNLAISHNKFIPTNADQAAYMVKSKSEQMYRTKRKRATSDSKKESMRGSIPPLDLKKAHQIREKGFTTQKSYTQEEVAAMLLKQAQRLTGQQDVTIDNDIAEKSHRLFEFGRDYHIPLSSLSKYDQLYNELYISPQVLAEIVYRAHNISNKAPMQCEIKQYEQVLRSNQKEYDKAVVLAFKILLEEDDADTRAELAVFHTRALQEHVDDQKRENFRWMVGAVLSFLGTIGSTVWAVYGEVNGCPVPYNMTGNSTS